MRGSRRASVALVVSVALHLLVLSLLVWRVAPPSEPALQPEQSVEIEIIEGPESPPHRAPTRRPEREKATRPEPPRKTAQAGPVPAPSPPSSSTPSPPVASGEPAPGPSASAPPAAQAPPAVEPGGPASSDAPRTPGNVPEAGDGVATSESGLVPAVPGTGKSQPNPYSAFSKGRTLHNGEGEEPDPNALAQMNAENAKRKVEGFLREDLGVARAQPGVVDSYFVGVGKTL